MQTSSIKNSFNRYQNTQPDNNPRTSSDIQQQIEKLVTRDQEVKTHEQAHLSAAGTYATGAASFTYQTGPDGKKYAIGGEVQIDTSAIANNPKASLRKAEVIRRAALAPAQPSDQDRAVAQSASAMMVKAHIELLQQTQSADTHTHSTATDSNIHYTV